MGNLSMAFPVNMGLNNQGKDCQITLKAENLSKYWKVAIFNVYEYSYGKSRLDVLDCLRKSRV